MIRYIFTVTTGRSGQVALVDLIRRHVSDAYPAFEEPLIHQRLPRVFWGIERSFRRRFIETDELLGRGKVLDAFANCDEHYLVRIAQHRQRSVESLMRREQKSIYIDVSKFFARGLHRGWERILPEFSLIRLVRDPICTMRSFLNRQKSFARDNNLPDARGNILRLEYADMEPGELYLWSWCELYLRYEQLVERGKASRAVEVRTEDLGDSSRMAAAFAALELAHTPLTAARRMNTNVERGFEVTRPLQHDIALFERFLGRIPPHILSKIRYLDGYDPYRHALATGDRAEVIESAHQRALSAQAEYRIMGLRRS